MATVSTPVLPEYLYRYRSLGPSDNFDMLNREIDAIIEPYIWCSDFLKLNDPMEGYFSISSQLKTKTSWNDVYEAIIKGQTNLGISSFSDTLENDLMWTHYASNWTGICIEFRTKKLIKGLPDDATIELASEI